MSNLNNLKVSRLKQSDFKKTGSSIIKPLKDMTNASSMDYRLDDLTQRLITKQDTLLNSSEMIQ